MRKAKITVAVIALVIISAFTYLAINSGVTAKNLQLKTIKLESTEEKLKDVNLQVEKLKTQSSTDKAKQEQLEKEKKELEAKLQAKADAKAKLELAAAEAERNLTASQTASAAPAPTVSGGKADWMRAAGIPEHEWGYVDSIVSRESGWNPNAVNKSSGACGLGQQLPCGKWAGAWNDPVAALRAMTGYVSGRYYDGSPYVGSLCTGLSRGWQCAVAFWNQNHWY